MPDVRFIATKTPDDVLLWMTGPMGQDPLDTTANNWTVCIGALVMRGHVRRVGDRMENVEVTAAGVAYANDLRRREPSS
jgi:hypothetical protein